MCSQEYSRTKNSNIKILTVLSKDLNNWVVRLPNRQHSGVVVQGDSLKVFFDLADEICELAGDRAELRDVAEELRDQLRERLTCYEKAVREHGRELPYTRPLT